MLAYFDCFSGIAGDMAIAAMLDIGLDLALLRETLSGLEVDRYELKAYRSSRQGISGTRFEVEPLDHGPHRRWRSIRNILESSALPESVKSRSLRIFANLAAAEARVHGVDMEDIHFHEVGAIDSIIDIVGFCVGLDALGIEEVISSPLPLNLGHTNSAHGRIPLPAPATLELLKDTPVRGAFSDIELVTPTGAAIIKTLASGFGPYPAFTPRRIGYGLGSSDPEGFPNGLRLVLGERRPGIGHRDEVVKLETNIDDLDPRILGHLMDKLLALPCLDVAFLPIHMKKNRPGTMVTVLVDPDLANDAAELILSHTTSLGVRAQVMGRFTLQRDVLFQDTSVGRIRIKSVALPDNSIEKRPEFDDLVKISDETGEPVRELLLRLERELNPK